MVEYLTCWLSSSDQSISVDGTTYNNIGTTYSHTEGNTTYGYRQNELTSMTTNALSESAYRSQYGLTDDELGGTDPNKACNKACDLMLGSSAGNNNCQIVENAGDGTAGAANANAASGINKLSMYLDLGQAVKATVDKRPKSSVRDGIGDHFVVIMGKTEKLATFYYPNGDPYRGAAETTFRFFDPGTRQEGVGNSPTAKFKLDNGRLVGESPYNSLSTGKRIPYTVTSFRFLK